MAKSITRIQASQAPVPSMGSDESLASTAILEFQSPTLTLISAPVPFSAKMTLWLISSLVLVSFILFSVVPTDRVVTTTGVVLAQQPDVIVQPYDATTIVRKIVVKEGQMVKKGDLLAELDPTFAGSDATATVSQMASLKAQVDRMRAELADKQYLSDGTQYSQLEELAYLQRHQQFVFTVEDYNQKIKSLQAQVTQAQGDIDGFKKRLVGLSSITQMRTNEEHMQVGSRLNTLQAQDMQYQIEQDLGDAKAQLDQYGKSMAAMVAERDSWIHQWYSDTQNLEGQQERMLSDMQRQAEQATKRRDLIDMRAEADSIVLSVSRVTAGTVVQVGTQLMTLVPVDSPLEVVALIDGSDAGFVSVGDPVSVKFDTLPYFRYGYAVGHVTKISDDSFVDPTAGQVNPQGTAATIAPTSSASTGTAPVYYYRAFIAIDKLTLRHPPESFRVMPGMPLEADIRVGQRTVLQYMLDKVVPFMVEGMREPT
jgi:HlyD family secretion protein